MKKSRHCFIPQCKSSSITSPHKRFLTVPRNIELRKLWFRAAQRQGEEVSRSSFWCCPDHFNLKEDLNNYKNYMTIGSPAKFKPGVVPHKFECRKKRGHKNSNQHCTTFAIKTDIDSDTPPPAEAMSEDGDPVNHPQSAAELMNVQVAAAFPTNKLPRLRRILPRVLPQEEPAQEPAQKPAQEPAQKPAQEVPGRQNKRMMKDLSLQEKMEILKRCDTGATGRDISAEFNIKLKTLYNIKKSAKKIRADAREMQHLMAAMTAKKNKSGPSSRAVLESRVFRWYQQKCASGIHVTADELQNAATKLAKQLHIKNFKANAWWLVKFQSLYNLAEFRDFEESDGASETVLPSEELDQDMAFSSTQHEEFTDPLAPTEAVFIVEKQTGGGAMENEYVQLKDSDSWHVNTPTQDLHTTPLVYTTSTQNVHTTPVVYTTPTQSVHTTPVVFTTPTQSVHTTPNQNVYTTPLVYTTSIQNVHTTSTQSVCTTPLVHTTPTQNVQTTSLVHTTPNMSVHNQTSNNVHSTPSQSIHIPTSKSLHNQPRQSAHSTPGQNIHWVSIQSRQSVHNPASNKAHNQCRQNVHSTPSQSVQSKPRQNVHTTSSHSVQNHEVIDLEPNETNGESNTCEPLSPPPPPPQPPPQPQPQQQQQPLPPPPQPQQQLQPPQQQPQPVPQQPQPQSLQLPLTLALPPAPAPPSEQDAAFQREIRQELREMRQFMRDMSSSMRSIKNSTKDIAETLKTVAAAFCNGIR